MASSRFLRPTLIGRSAASKFRLSGWIVLLALVAGSAQPLTGQTAEDGGTDAIVFVPGVTGSRLENPSTGRVLWGESSQVFSPRDRGHSSIFPISKGAAPFDGVQATEVLSHLRLFGYTREVYRPLRRHLQKEGHQLGDLAAPRSSDDFYLFAYDWRRENQQAVEELDAALERLAKARSNPRVRLVCQSNAGRICRYVAKYGGADPSALAAQSEAAASNASSNTPPSYRIVQLVLVSNSHGGALRQLHEMHKGRRYVPGVGRFMGQETLFALRTLFEDLPFYRQDLFLDESGAALSIDLFDAQSWQRYGFSVFAKDMKRRLDRDRSGLFGTESLRLAYLEERLAEARRVNDLLLADSPRFQASLCLLQNLGVDTIERAVIKGSDAKGWQLLFAGDRGVPRSLKPRLISRGDGHGTEDSQNFFSAQERAAITQRHLVQGGHFDTITRSETLAAVSACLRETG